VTTALDARYGRTPGRRRRAVLLAIVVGAAVLVTVVVWVIWVGLFTPNAAVQSEDVGSTPVDDSTIRVVSQISADPGAHVHCSVEALTEDFAVVGWKVVALPPTEHRVQRVTTTVRTTQRAVSGLIGSCWVT
jgi:hypothetical protein